LRTLTEKLRNLPGLRLQRLPTSSALTKARQRLGEKPLRVLFEQICGPLATPATAEAYAFGLRLVAWDGTTLDVPDTAENATAFGYSNPAINTCGNLQVRLMTLVECGTHGLVDAVFDGVEHSNEYTLGRFAVTVQLVRLGVPDQVAATANRLRRTLETVTAELLDDLLPARRNRRCERVKKPSKNKFAIKRRDQPRTPSNVRYSLKVARHRPLPAETS
jgi:Insertion element 4 transposase N-terminal